MASNRMQIIAAILLTLLFSAHSFPFDPKQNNQYGNTSIFETECNIQTQIDFFLSTETELTCNGNTCSVTNGQSSSMKFLDINGLDLSLTLQSAEFTSVDLVSEADNTADTNGALPGANYFVLSFKSGIEDISMER